MRNLKEVILNLTVAVLVVFYLVRGFVLKLRDRLRRASHGTDSAGSLEVRNNKIIRAAAESMGCTVSELPNDYLAISYQGVTQYSWGSNFAFESLLATRICGNKEVSQEMLRSAGYPVPEFERLSFRDIGAAIGFLKRSNGPVVVKPSKGNGGDGVTIGIGSTWGMIRAFARAVAQSNGRVMVERHVPGTNYRITVLDGAVISVIERRQANVVGDGDSTIEALVLSKNETLNDAGSGRRVPITLDRRARRYLNSEGHSPGWVPPEGEVVYLRQMCYANQGGELRDMTLEAHPSYGALARNAADLVGARLCGIDVITDDVTRPVDETSCVINELNTTPGLYFVEVPGGGRDTRIGERLVSLMMGIDDAPSIGMAGTPNPNLTAFPGPRRGTG
jgi:cyanophycin synthetase